MGDFRKRVFERRPAIPDPLCADVLRPVDMAERDVVERIENRCVDIVRAAYRDIL